MKKVILITTLTLLSITLQAQQKVQIKVLACEKECAIINQAIGANIAIAGKNLVR